MITRMQENSYHEKHVTSSTATVAPFCHNSQLLTDECMLHYCAVSILKSVAKNESQNMSSKISSNLS